MLLVAPVHAVAATAGWQNLRSILNGSLMFGSLSASEQAAVADAAREMRRRNKVAGLTPYQRCRLASLTSKAPSALEEATIDLKCSQR
ncbi:MAG: hypothetical protein V4537_12100 [Pseudomonadota bacterium]